MGEKSGRACVKRGTAGDEMGEIWSKYIIRMYEKRTKLHIMSDA